MIDLSSFGPSLNIAIIGATGGIGAAFTDHFAQHDQVQNIFACARNPVPSNGKITPLRCDILDDASIIETASQLNEHGPLDICLVATGFLHDEDIAPEKSNNALTRDAMQKIFELNTTGPALVARHILPLLNRKEKSVFAALSARIGSISDNKIGGWHSYRASKAALNMMIKTMAIELTRRAPSSLIIGLHPGTVNTGLSKPFQGNVPDGKLFTADYSTEQLIAVLNMLTPESSGKCFDYAGKEIPA